MTTEEFKELALSFPGTAEHPHFDRTAFKVETKRIFATLHEPSQSVNFKFSPEDQLEFCKFNPDAVSQIPNKWGLQGWTTIELNKASYELILSALESAYNDVMRTNKK